MRTLNRFIIAFAFGMGFFSWQSCKERTVTKPDMIPPVDNIHTFRFSTDSLNISLQTGVKDSVRTNTYTQNQSPIVALGRIKNDPFFGQLSAGLAVQFIPPGTETFSFPDADKYTFDSAFLCLPYVGFSYGDTMNPRSNILTFNVFRINQDMDVADSNVFTSDRYSHSPIFIGQGNYSLQSLKDSFAVGKDTLAGQLRIKLNKNYINQRIIQIDTTHFTNAQTFLNYFKGWYIKPVASAASANRISYFALAGSDLHHTARVDFYFHSSTNPAKVSSFAFGLIQSAYANYLKRNHQFYPAQDFLNHQVKRDSFLIEGTPGFYTDITLRNMDKFPPCVINQAELVINAIPVGDDENFIPPKLLFIEKVLPTGEAVPIDDVFGNGGIPTTGGLNFMGGKPKSVIINGKKYTQYKLNFPRELQNTILAGKDSLVLRVSAKSSYIGAFRMVAPGFNNTKDTKAKLNIIYTKTD